VRSVVPLRQLRDEHAAFQWTGRTTCVEATPVAERRLADSKSPRREAKFRRAAALYRTGAAAQAGARTTSDFCHVDGALCCLPRLGWRCFSKLVNRPVAALAAGTEAISKGQLDYAWISAPPTNWPELVQSLQYGRALESSRGMIDASSRELGAANEALERRRRYIERFWESIPSA